MSVGFMLMEGDLERIARSDIRMDKKIIMLWLLHQIDYGGPIGERAGELLKELVEDPEAFVAFSQILEFCFAKADPGARVELFNKMREEYLN